MSTELSDRLSAAYPDRGVGLPPAERLWERGRRQRRHRIVGGAVAATAVIAAAGAGLASLPATTSAPPPTLSQPSDGAHTDTGEVAPQDAQPVPDPAHEGDLAVPDDAARFDVSIFLCDGRVCPQITAAEREQLRRDLEAEPAVAEVFFESKEQAHERFRSLFEDQPELADSVDLDALAASFRVKLHDRGQVGVIAEQFAAHAGVEEVVDQGSCQPGHCERFVPEVDEEA